MLKNLKLSTKLWSLTALLLMAVLIVAGTSIKSIKSVLSANNQYAGASENNTFMVEKEVDHLKWVGKVQELFMNNAKTLEVQLDPTKCGLGRFLHGEKGKQLANSDPKLGTLIKEMKVPHQHLHASGSEINGVWRQRHEGLVDMLKDRLDDHRKWASKVSQIIVTQNPDIHVQLDHTRCAFGKFLASDEYAHYTENFPELKTAMEAASEPHRRLHVSAGDIKTQISDGNYEEAANLYNSVTLNELERVQAQFKQAIEAEMAIVNAQAEAKQIFEAKTLPALKQTQTKMKDLSEHLASVQDLSKKGMIDTGQTSQWSSIAITVIAFILGGLMSFFLIRSITKPVKRIIDGLNGGADQVAAASEQVSSSSQSLAEGASEQAASIEETSSSLEEMSSMTKQNADHANQADRLMKKVNQVVHGANDAMHDLTESMQDISKASEETSKIIKTIDEIAFQTNLLALNAAVEAARAGEAGAGFAVVADEVRNLAMRAAEAAKNTATLIEGTAKKVEDGSALVTRSNEAFSSVTESASKVGDLVSEITAASSEQSSGIDQINIAVAEMDKVVQSNAGNAEENASASEEMNAQAEQMKSFVAELVSLVNGNSKGNGKQTLRKLTDTPTRPTSYLTVEDLKKDRAHKNSQMKASQVIPFDEDAFEDF